MKNYVIASLFVAILLVSINFTKAETFTPELCASTIAQKDQVISQLIGFISGELKNIVAKNQEAIESYQPPLGGTVNPPVTPPVTPPTIPPVINQSPLEVKITTLPPTLSGLTYFQFDKDIYVKTLKVRIKNLVKTDDSDFKIANTSLGVTRFIKDTDKFPSSFAYDSVVNWGANEFVVEVNSVIKSSDKLLLGWAGGKTSGTVNKLELELVGNESIAILPNTNTSIIIPSLSIVVIDNENN